MSALATALGLISPLVPSPDSSDVAEPEPSGGPTDAPIESEDITGVNMCGTQDATLCGVINDLTGNQDLAETLSVIVGTPLFILVVIVGAALLRYVLLRIIRRVVQRISEGATQPRRRLDLFEPDDPVTAERRVQRSQAIGSILRAVVTVVVWSVAVLLILPALGADVTALIASAGILGVALGFGAQTLVADFISGIFMIAEDQYGVGDVIDMGEATGVVEAVGLRVTRLRSVDGTVWHVRNGEVLRVGNMSQGWSRALLDVGVGYGADVTHVMAVLKEVGVQMRADPDYGAKFLDDPEVWGVEALSDNAVTIRMIIKTVPLEQWVVAREMRRRIKHEFDRQGIEITFPQRTVWIRTEGPGTTDPQPGRRSGLRGRGRGGTAGQGIPQTAPIVTGSGAPPASGSGSGSGSTTAGSWQGGRAVTGPIPRVEPPKGEAGIAQEDSPDTEELDLGPGTPDPHR